MKLNGFTLIEICIVLAIFLLISTITFPSLWFFKQQQILSEVDKIYSVLNYLKQSAITSNKDLVLKFNLKDNSLSYELHTLKLSPQIVFGIKDGVKGPPSAPNRGLTNAITFKNDEIVFYKDGKMQPGTVYLTDLKKHYLYAITVPISQISLIRKYKYKNKWVLLI